MIVNDFLRDIREANNEKATYEALVSELDDVGDSSTEDEEEEKEKKEEEELREVGHTYAALWLNSLSSYLRRKKL